MKWEQVDWDTNCPWRLGPCDDYYYHASYSPKTRLAYIMNRSQPGDVKRVVCEEIPDELTDIQDILRYIETLVRIDT